MFAVREEAENSEEAVPLQNGDSKGLLPDKETPNIVVEMDNILEPGHPVS